ncbi:alpha/beta fold hydrolase [Endozoicomonas ascidiicola]|uniref:alpha/beta fold hydrolase n=1 Tax=Endozoicomonas ascidiicola TaxID=1698521 RepID=UPI000836FC19|nr:alpha/beta fold hydrolase [Endozoicomonas ascidiicola]
MYKSPVGYRRFNPHEHFNFQLNRWLPFLQENDLISVGAKINTIEQWNSAMLSMAEEKERFGHDAEAAFYYRAAEFFLHHQDPLKAQCYEKFIALFDSAYGHLSYERHLVPFAGAQLPAIVIEAEAEGEVTDTLVVHGGFDSFMEELLMQIMPAQTQGMRVIVFEGPGQGAALKKYGLSMPYDWERPVAAVLDHFSIDSCTLLGISLGGYLATRAAAFEPRIKRVIADDVLEDFYGCLEKRFGAVKSAILGILMRLKMKPVLNAMMSAAAKRDVITRWALEHGQYVSGVDSPYEYLKWAQSLNTREISKHLTQDYLLLAGRSDHLVPLEQFFSQAQRLKNVKSFTGRIFSDEEDAGSHCHVGNNMLAVEIIKSWMDTMAKRDAQ